MKAKKSNMLPIHEWCNCNEWRQFHGNLENFDRMNFCVFCGSVLVKKVKQNKKESKHE